MSSPYGNAKTIARPRYRGERFFWAILTADPISASAARLRIAWVADGGLPTPPVCPHGLTLRPLRPTCPGASIIRSEPLVTRRGQQQDLVRASYGHPPNQIGSSGP